MNSWRNIGWLNSPDAEVVDTNNCNPEYSNKYSWVDAIPVNPVLYDERASRQLIWCDNDVFEPVGITRHTVLEPTCDS